MKYLLVLSFLTLSACASGPVSRDVASTKAMDEVVGISLCNSSTSGETALTEDGASWSCQDLK